jgi:hypothetical protein
MLSQFKLSELGGGDPVLSARLSSVGVGSANMLQYVQVLLCILYVLMNIVQVVRCQGQTDDMCYQKPHSPPRT